MEPVQHGMEDGMKTAKEIVKLPEFNGDARVYECSPPMEWEDYDCDTCEYVAQTPAQYVIVSAAVVPYSGPETYIFPAKRMGDIFDVADWSELEGSYRGGLDHAEALEGAGYKISDTTYIDVEFVEIKGEIEALAPEWKAK